MKPLHKSAYFTITVDPLTRIVSAWRSPEPFPSLAEVERCLSAMAADLAGTTRGQHALLLDVRDGPMRNDDGFEEAMGRHRATLFEGLVASAVLVRTAAGRLQLTRMARQEKLERPVFTDDAEARNYLLGALRAQR